MWLPAVQTITITALTQLLCNILPAYTVVFSLMTRKVERVFIYHTIWGYMNQVVHSRFDDGPNIHS